MREDTDKYNNPVCCALMCPRENKGQAFKESSQRSANKRLQTV